MYAIVHCLAFISLAEEGREETELPAVVMKEEPGLVVFRKVEFTCTSVVHLPFRFASQREESLVLGILPGRGESCGSASEAVQRGLAPWRALSLRALLSCSHGCPCPVCLGRVTWDNFLSMLFFMCVLAWRGTSLRTCTPSARACARPQTCACAPFSQHLPSFT